MSKMKEFEQPKQEAPEKTFPFTQVEPHKKFPSGDYIFLMKLGQTPDQISGQYGIQFTEQQDDLDKLQLAAIKLDEGDELWLSQYDGLKESDPGTDIRADSQVEVADLQDRVKEAFGLAEEDVIWRRDPAIPKPQVY